MFILRELGIHILYNERVKVPEYNTKTYPYPRTQHKDYCKTCSSSSAIHKAEEVYDSSASQLIDQVREIIDTTTGIALSHVSSEVPLIIDQKQEEETTIGKGGMPEGSTSTSSSTSATSSSSLSNEEYSTFDLAGIPDYAASILAGINHRYNISMALANRDLTRELILLAHQPKHIHETAIYGIGLQLSGHTHGGQIFPLQIPVYFANPYFVSLYKHESYIPGNIILEETLSIIQERYKSKYNEQRFSSTWFPTFIYVSRGSLYWGPPMRMGSPHEITCITLRSMEIVGPNFEGRTMNDQYVWSV